MNAKAEEGCLHGKAWKEPCIECKKVWYSSVRDAAQKTIKEAERMSDKPVTTEIYCSFCGDHCKKCSLVQGPTVYICFGCIDECNKIMKDNIGRFGIVNPSIDISHDDLMKRLKGNGL